MTDKGSEDVHSLNVHVINFNDGVFPYMPDLIFQKAATEEVKLQPFMAAGLSSTTFPTSKTVFSVVLKCQ